MQASKSYVSFSSQYVYLPYQEQWKQIILHNFQRKSFYFDILDSDVLKEKQT